MNFTGFRRSTLAELSGLPNLDSAAYANRRERLHGGLVAPARALLQEVVAQLDAPLTISDRASVSPLHTDLRFAPAGAPRYKDHLLLTTWHGADKKVGATLWIRIDSSSVGFASGIAFTPAVRERWRTAVAGTEGATIVKHMEALRKRHCGHDFEVAGDELRRVPAPWADTHPRSELLRKKGFQLRFRLPLPNEVERPVFALWCATRLNELLPVHRWLVKHLIAKDDAR